MTEVPRKKILVVEDLSILALDLEQLLLSWGYEVVGPAGSLDRGLHFVKSDKVDAAILDVNLNGVEVFPLAEQLAAQNIPFIFLTGYDAAETIPARFKACPYLQKPVNREALLNCLHRLLAAG